MGRPWQRTRLTLRIHVIIFPASVCYWLCSFFAIMTTALVQGMLYQWLWHLLSFLQVMLLVFVCLLGLVDGHFLQEEKEEPRPSKLRASSTSPEHPGPQKDLDEWQSRAPWARLHGQYIPDTVRKPGLVVTLSTSVIKQWVLNSKRLKLLKIIIIIVVFFCPEKIK